MTAISMAARCRKRIGRWRARPVRPVDALPEGPVLIVFTASWDGLFTLPEGRRQRDMNTAAERVLCGEPQVIVLANEVQSISVRKQDGGKD